MKKILSVVLALMMVLTTVSALIPTVWAEPGDPSNTESGAVATRPDGSWVYYEQNFDSEDLSGLTDVALFEALNWTGTAFDTTQTMLIEDGALRFVSSYYKANGKTKASTYQATLPVGGDERMLTNVTVLEYDIKHQRRAKDDTGASDLVVGEKTVKADGQDAKQQFLAIFGSNNTAGRLFASRFDVQGTLNLKALNGSNAPGLTAESTISLQSQNNIKQINPVPAGTALNDLEYQGSSKTGGYSATGFDFDYHVKIVIDPTDGTYLLMVNDVLIASLEDNNNYAAAICERIEALTDAIILGFPNSSDILLDNIQVYGYTPAPSLVITEIATNGYGVDTALNGTVSMKMGGFQWVEVYNPTLTPVNVYDYALYVNNNPAADTTFGGAAEPATEVSRLSGLGYLKTGVQSFTLADETISTYENPAYEDGALQPGEAAILLLPETLHAAGTALNVDDIARAMKRMDVAEGTKILVCDDYTANSFVLAANGPMVIGLMEVENAGQEDVEGKYVGLDDSLRTLLESYVIMTTEGVASEAVYEGFAVYNYIPKEVALGTNQKTVEITYWDLRNSTITSRMGYPKYDANDPRQTVTGENGYVTPGFVPSACRFNVSIKVYDKDGKNPQTMSGKFMDKWTLEDVELFGYKFLGYSVDGSDELVDSVFMSRDGIEIQPVYERVAPLTFVQVSEMTADGTYAIRLLGGVNRTDIESVGFRYSYTYVNSYGTEITVAPEEAYHCQYVYTSVTENGEIRNATDLGCEYLFALHITDIPEAVGEITLTVTTFFIESKTTMDQPIEDVEQMFVLQAPEAYVPEDTTPEGTEPEVTESEGTEPEGTEPEATEPEATEPEATEPEATEPEATEPEATEPEATEPEATEPEATEPEATEPEATEPEATEPEATEPEATESVASES